MKVDIIIPTYKPNDTFCLLLQKLQEQTFVVHRLILLNTEERLWEEAKEKYPIEECLVALPFPHTILHVTKETFDHGGTRNLGAKESEADVVMYMTQDAVPADHILIEELLKGMEQENVGIAYGRQLAGRDADITEKLTRLHSYPEQECLKTRADLESLGIKTYFCSDVCAMYDRRLYEELGGFSYPTIFNEDMIMASKVVQAGYGVFYAAKAKVFHSHSYTCKQQFVRNFDLGVSQSQYSEIFENVSSEKEGAGFAKKTILTLCKKMHFGKAVYFAWQCAFRLAGYKLGKNYERLPKKVILYCTMSPGYWKE